MDRGYQSGSFRRPTTCGPSTCGPRTSTTQKQRLTAAYSPVATQPTRSVEQLRGRFEPSLSSTPASYVRKPQYKSAAPKYDPLATGARRKVGGARAPPHRPFRDDRLKVPAPPVSFDPVRRPKELPSQERDTLPAGKHIPELPPLPEQSVAPAQETYAATRRSVPASRLTTPVAYSIPSGFGPQAAVVPSYERTPEEQLPKSPPRRRTTGAGARKSTGGRSWTISFGPRLRTAEDEDWQFEGLPPELLQPQPVKPKQRRTIGETTRRSSGLAYDVLYSDAKARPPKGQLLRKFPGLAPKPPPKPKRKFGSMLFGKTPESRITGGVQRPPPPPKKPILEIGTGLSKDAEPSVRKRNVNAVYMVPPPHKGASPAKVRETITHIEKLTSRDDPNVSRASSRRTAAASQAMYKDSILKNIRRKLYEKSGTK